jgi:adenine phosphoribosyltransferase
VVRLVEGLGAEVVGLGFAIELEDLGGRDNLKGYEVESLITY